MKPTREQVLSEPAGRQLDAWIAEYAMGWDLARQIVADNIGLTDFSDNFAALKQVIDLPRPDFAWHIESENIGDSVKWFTMIWGGDDLREYSSNALEDSLEVAVCHAALLYAIERT